MNKKQDSCIKKIVLNEATFKNSEIHPTFINFFFGNNGTGKTTVSRLIQAERTKTNSLPAEDVENNAIFFSDDDSRNNYNILVFNEDFIASNLSTIDCLPGVFSINEDNISIQNDITEKELSKQDIDKQIKATEEIIDSLTEKISTSSKQFKENIWKKTEELRLNMPDTQIGFKKDKDKFLNKLLETTPVNNSIDELSELYKIAFDPNAKLYTPFSRIEDINCLDTILDDPLFQKRIVGSDSSEFSDFIDSIGASDWVMQGFKDFSPTPDNKCPYCQQILPNDFYQQVTHLYDKKYYDSIDHIKDILEKYKSSADALINILRENDKNNDYDEIDLKDYNREVELLILYITENLRLIENKINEPTKTISPKITKSFLQEIDNIILKINQKIDSNNEIVNKKIFNQDVCKSRIWEVMSFQLQEDIGKFNKEKKDLKKEVKEKNDLLIALRGESKQIKEQIQSMLGKIKNTSSTIESMNETLRDSGFSGFYIREKQNDKNMYEVVRPDGTVANGLSEGEKNFIAFLYFYQLVKGGGNVADAEQIVNETGKHMLTDGSDTRDKIVVIDDPVSSMDSGSMFIICGLVREMIEICRNNVSIRDNQVSSKYIKQIFILTHNAFFHKEVTSNQERHFRYVSFYKINKIDNESTISLCTRKKQDEPSSLENYNPVQNSYAALWEEYKEIHSTIPMMNVMRRILEYYFIQICGYEGLTLQDIILVKNKEKFIMTDPETREQNSTRLQLASSLLRYLDYSTFSTGDGLHFIDECINTTEAHKTFKMIFDLMGQSQHYSMMANQDTNKTQQEEI